MVLTASKILHFLRMLILFSVRSLSSFPRFSGLEPLQDCRNSAASPRRSHALFCENALAVFEFLPRGNEFSLQLRISFLIFQELWEVKLCGGVKPLVRKSRYHTLAFVSFHPFLIAGARAQVVHDVDEAEDTRYELHEMFSYQVEIVTSGVEPDHRHPKAPLLDQRALFFCGEFRGHVSGCFWEVS